MKEYKEEGTCLPVFVCTSCAPARCSVRAALHSPATVLPRAISELWDMGLGVFSRLVLLQPLCFLPKAVSVHIVAANWMVTEVLWPRGKRSQGTAGLSPSAQQGGSKLRSSRLSAGEMCPEEGCPARQGCREVSPHCGT